MLEGAILVDTFTDAKTRSKVSMSSTVSSLCSGTSLIKVEIQFLPLKDR